MKSHITAEFCLISILSASSIIAACRGGEDRREWLSGKTTTYRHFQVAESEGRVYSCKPNHETTLPVWASGVSQEKWDWKVSKPDSGTSLFLPPIPFVLPPLKGTDEPFFPHNHQPSITWLDNGDMLAIWYSTIEESGTELTVLASRLRNGKSRWDASSEFFKAKDRNMHGSSLFNDGRGMLFHFNGMGAEGVRKDQSKDLALVLRVSADNGRSWSDPLAIAPEYRNNHQAISGTLLTRGGLMIQPCDVVKMKGSNQSAIYVSRNRGKTWFNPAEQQTEAIIENGAKGGRLIAGIHAAVVELQDGRLMALSRRHDIDGRMPLSLSENQGETWTYAPSSFPPIGGGQRLVLSRLREGPLLLVSFTDKRKAEKKNGMRFHDQNGEEFTGYGMFAALSFDEGTSWPVKKLITPGSGEYNGGGWTGPFTASPTRAEHGGYLAATQSPDGIIHLVSSRLYYRFNLAWLKEPNSVP